MSDIGNRLKILRGDLSRDVYAPKLGVSKNTIVNYETGKSAPDSTFLTKILDLHPDISPSWLLTGKGSTHTGIRNNQELLPKRTNELVFPDIHHLEAPDPKEFDYIPMAKATLSAGGGAFVVSEEFEGYYAFRKSWINAITTSKNNLVLLRVDGDSMDPTIQDRDTVMIDMSRRQIIEGKIFALRADNTIMIKRLSFRLNEKIQIISDNKRDFEPYEVNISDIHILGQVIFFSRVLIAE